MQQDKRLNWPRFLAKPPLILLSGETILATVMLKTIPR
jgi:hypothetical protein